MKTIRQLNERPNEKNSMKVLPKFLKNGNHKCLVCEKSVDKNFSEVQYAYRGGVGKAYLCDGCGDEMEKNKLDQGGDDGFSI